jgi:hypothetical protein
VRLIFSARSISYPRPPGNPCSALDISAYVTSRHGFAILISVGMVAAITARSFVRTPAPPAAIPLVAGITVPLLRYGVDTFFRALHHPGFVRGEFFSNRYRGNSDQYDGRPQGSRTRGTAYFEPIISTKSVRGPTTNIGTGPTNHCWSNSGMFPR